ncbi:uncharacterized protein LY79DRAFT_211568 [Colletotrichum navitas]|uniref:Uncharacterized protein n=1 Tax=Colletotrichum navitas TaxID=681940 RepID=A0AAD8QAN1_9PEZI|nr:uncharacterized protein LY79DRAFT_211568 [Colletotrichum navitas]KAK1599183.1 hypothetical protein LY79DRAFT_211568 [Colletotrichum navitas]
MPLVRSGWAAEAKTLALRTLVARSVPLSPPLLLPACPIVSVPLTSRSLAGGRSWWLKLVSSKVSAPFSWGPAELIWPPLHLVCLSILTGQNHSSNEGVPVRASADAAFKGPNSSLLDRFPKGWCVWMPLVLPPIYGSLSHGNFCRAGGVGGVLYTQTRGQRRSLTSIGSKRSDTAGDQ